MWRPGGRDRGPQPKICVRQFVSYSLRLLLYFLSARMPHDIWALDDWSHQRPSQSRRCITVQINRNSGSPPSDKSSTFLFYIDLKQDTKYPKYLPDKDTKYPYFISNTWYQNQNASDTQIPKTPGRAWLFHVRKYSKILPMSVNNYVLSYRL